MSSTCYGFSSYMLITPKGLCFLPFVRGSCFVVPYHFKSFYSYHVITAQHVLWPHKFKELFLSPDYLKMVGQRHLSSKLLDFDDKTGERTAMVDLAFKAHGVHGCDVVSCRFEDEKKLTECLPDMKVTELDLDPISQGEDVYIDGMDIQGNRDAGESDDIQMLRTKIPASVVAAYQQEVLGTMILGTTKVPVPLSTAGAPVIRKSSGKCVGMCVLATRKTEPTQEEMIHKFMEPTINLCDSPAAKEVIPGYGFGFIPVGEIYKFLRKQESV